MTSTRATSVTLFLCLGVSQAAVLVLTPVLAAVAADLDVSTATAGQLRTISGLSAGATALCMGLLAPRVGLRELMGAGLSRRERSPAAAARADLRAVLSQPGVLRWSSGELLAFSAWAGTLVFAGALFVESYGLSLSATGLVLGAAAAVYVPGNLVFRRLVDDHARTLLVALALSAAATVAVLSAVRPS